PPRDEGVAWGVCRPLTPSCTGVMCAMRKRVLAASSALLLFLLLSAVSFAQPLPVGVLQLVEHPALDAARQGFIDRLSELGYEAKFDIQSAQNEMSIAVTIAQKFKSDRKDLVLAIATPAAQAAVNVIDDIPILITDRK